MNANLNVPTKTRAEEWPRTEAQQVRSPHPYEKLRAINVSDRIEKKNGLSYLSWAFAVDTLLQADASANWEYQPAEMYGETMMVRCAVTAFGKTMTAHLPVMDHRNQPIPMPNAFQVNTAMQRCLVKAIALHGIGLYIYAGEDLPATAESHEEPRRSDAKGDLGMHVDPKVAAGIADEFRAAFDLDVDEAEKTEAVWKVHERIASDAETYVAVGDQLSAKERAAIKAYVAQHKNGAKNAYVNARGR